MNLEQFIFKILAKSNPSDIFTILASTCLKKAGVNKPDLLVKLASFPLPPGQAKLSAFSELESDFIKLFDKGVEPDAVFTDLAEVCSKEEPYIEGYTLDDVLLSFKNVADTYQNLYQSQTSDDDTVAYLYWGEVSQVIDNILDDLPEPNSPQYWENCAQSISNAVEELPTWSMM